MEYPLIRLLIDGRWRPASGGIAVTSPNDGATLGTVPVASRQDLENAVAAAERGLEAWRGTAPLKRARILNQAARILRDRADPVSRVITMELGKPLAQSRGEVERAVEIIEWDAAEGQRLYGRVVPGGPGVHQTVLREPVGIVAAFSPWNFPLGSPTRKVSGALAAGCSVILKAAEETPASAMLLCEAFQEAGLPDGALNLVFGRPAEISDFLITHPSVRFVTFTGSVPVGKQLASLAGAHMKGAIMELGGHAPVIVCADADPSATARMAVAAKCRNSGQICVSATRFHVHDAIFDAFADAFVAAAGAVVLGSGLDPASQMGPLANERRMAAIGMLVEDAVAAGARLRCGGERIGDKGYYYPLTVLTDVPPAAKIMLNEPFGPVAVINRFSDLRQAVSAANSLPLGLAAYVFTHRVETIDHLVANLRCGNIGINHFVPSSAEIPFGGVFDSGFGREGGMEGVSGYTVVKSVSRLGSATL